MNNSYPITYFTIFLTSVFFVFISCNKIELSLNTIESFQIESDSITFAIIGDYGDSGDPELQVSKLVKSWSPDFILTLGDNNYNNGKLSTIKKNITDYYGDYIYNPDAPSKYRCNGKAFDEQLNRFFPTLGNHDSKSLQNAQPYLTYFSLPNKETYYDFQWGAVHFFSIHSGATGDATCCDSEQAIWLKEKMTKSDSPFKIVYFHHPPYSASKHGSTKSLQWDFEEWGASAVFSGHEHSYQRIIKRNNPEFPYIVNGLGGRKSIYDCNVHPLDNGVFDSFCFNENYGAIKVIATKEKLCIRFYRIDMPDTPVDEFIIEK